MIDTGTRTQALIVEIGKLEQGHNWAEVFTASAAITVGIAHQVGMTKGQLRSKMDELWDLCAEP